MLFTFPIVAEEIHTTSCPFPGMYDVTTGPVTSSSEDSPASHAECSTTLLSGCNGSSVIAIEENCEDSGRSGKMEAHREEKITT